MRARIASVGLMMAIGAALVGCGGGKAPPKGGVASAVKPLVQTRKDLFDIAKKIEDPAALATLENDVRSFEKSFELPADDPGRWSWPELNERVTNGPYSIQTKLAYDKWRLAKMAEDNRR